MGVCVGDLDQRQIESLRNELAETLAADFAYPPFFDFAARQARVRPVDQKKRREIDEFLRSTNFAAVERSEVGSPELRRFIEGLILRYLEVNPAMAPMRLQRRLPALRSRVPRAAVGVQRALVAHIEGSTQSFGRSRPQSSWSETLSRTQQGTSSEHNTRVLESVLVRSRSAELGKPADLGAESEVELHQKAPARAAPTVPASIPLSAHARDLSDATVPVASQPKPLPAQVVAAPPDSSPFAGLEMGSQSTAFASISGFSERPTGPLVVDTTGIAAPGAAGASSQSGNGGVPRELPPDLYQLYGEYLRDMQPEAARDDDVPQSDPPTLVLPIAPSSGAQPDGAVSVVETPAPQREPESASQSEAQGDQLIFLQLRYQLEAYVRRAARTYGLRAQSADPSGILDTLRHSGFVDEADLRIAEGILALTDRVIGSGMASVSDYRQALTLYLLYHRSHLGD